MSKIGELIKETIKNSGETRVSIAKKAGVTESAIRNWEQNGLDNAKISNVKKLASAIKVDPLVLLGILPITENDKSLILARKIKKLNEKDSTTVENLVESLGGNDD